MIEVYEIRKFLESPLAKLRHTLARRGFAFGALFIAASHNCQLGEEKIPQGHVILMSDEMPVEMRIGMLTDFIDTAQKTIEQYRKASANGGR